MSAPVSKRCPGCGAPIDPSARDHRADPTCGWRAQDGPRPRIDDDTEDEDA